MILHFAGYSHAPNTLAAAAIVNGMQITPTPDDADLVFISQDTPTDQSGIRDQEIIKDWIARTRTSSPVVITSQVEPGFTRSLGIPSIFCMAETLRMKDAMERAISPEQFILGKSSLEMVVPAVLNAYMGLHHGAVIHEMLYEEAEFAKIAINMFLAAQVDCTNRLAKAAAMVGANWAPLAEVLKSDKRIGPHAYTSPGRWQDSTHLLRDHVTLEKILARG